MRRPGTAYHGHPGSGALLAHARGNYRPPGPPEDPWGPYIREAGKRFDVPDLWIRSVMRVESGGNEYLNGQLITSGAGAMGLMQVMPETYGELRDRYSLGDDPFDPHDNILAGAAYLREMYDIYGSPGFLAAYNAGPRRLDDYLSNNRPLPDETRRYVAMIGPNIVGVYPISRSPAEDYAMNALPIEHSARDALWPAQCSWRARAAVAAACRPVGRSRLRSCREPRARCGAAGAAAICHGAAADLPPPQHGGFSLIQQAVAEPVPMRHGGPPTRRLGDPGWCIFERRPGTRRGWHCARAGRGGIGRGARSRVRRASAAWGVISRAADRVVARGGDAGLRTARTWPHATAW